MNLDGAPVGLRDGHLVPGAREVGRDGTGGAAADDLDRRGLGPGGRVTGDGLLGVLVRGGSVPRAAWAAVAL